MRIQEGKHPQAPSVTGRFSLHEMAVADDDGLAGQRIARETRQEKRGCGDIFQGSELSVHCFSQHDVFDDFLFADPELLRLFRDLFLDQRGANKAGANDV